MLAVFDDSKQLRHESVKITGAGVVLTVLLVETGTGRVAAATECTGSPGPSTKFHRHGGAVVGTEHW